MTHPSSDRLVKYLEELEQVLESGADMLADWGSYAAPYFQEKHCLEADIAYLRSHAARVRKVVSGIDPLGEYD